MMTTLYQIRSTGEVVQAIESFEHEGVRGHLVEHYNGVMKREFLPCDAVWFVAIKNVQCKPLQI